MTYKDTNTPPEKGQFEYKTKDKIFSREKIGKYSVKIKQILDCIYNEKDDIVSEGIILIYSNYIDGGLIPMALALEEMGFTRYGQEGIKPLFKTRPSEVVDVNTMKPPKKKEGFKPARYSMITGDPRLSPNNDLEVKGATSENNVKGEVVKVILVSKAGSEGIDFKFIRQIHLLDPWYNMNRPEQVIGRGVRNFSHKDLPFEHRNVQIYMHGTILGNNIEEPADLYVYRVAEYKAVQIGKVTRLLKETSVDCIINEGQQEFTQQNMSAKLKKPVTQILSTGEKLENFKVGDAPFSPTCDYMASCNYDCRPDSDIDEKNLNEDTYDENFIVMNSDKILQRIRMLFKEAFFYKKDTLLKSIRIQKDYPYVQIFSALTRLIEDENEFIVDRYGRNGRLVNIGEYYLFQPVELKDKNISIYDRAVPIDYKHSMINFELKQTAVKKVLDKRNLNDDEPLMVDSEGKKVLDEMRSNYNLAQEFSKQPKVPKSDYNWYKHCGVVIRKMSKEYPESAKYLLEFLVSHMIELLLFKEKIQLMDYIYSLENISKNSLEGFVKSYFEKNTIATDKYIVFIGYDVQNRKVMILNKSNKWIEASPEEQRKIVMSSETKDFLSNVDGYNDMVGFIGYEKGNKSLVFKTKNMNSKRDKGARCDQAQKNINIKKINDIIGEEKYTLQNTKAHKDEEGQMVDSVENTELCVLVEMTLRFFNATNKNGKIWFVTPEMAIFHKFYTVFDK